MSADVTEGITTTTTTTTLYSLILLEPTLRATTNTSSSSKSTMMIMTVPAEKVVAAASITPVANPTPFNKTSSPTPAHGAGDVVVPAAGAVPLPAAGGVVVASKLAYLTDTRVATLLLWRFRGAVIALLLIGLVVEEYILPALRGPPRLTFGKKITPGHPIEYRCGGGGVVVVLMMFVLVVNGSFSDHNVIPPPHPLSSLGVLWGISGCLLVVLTSTWSLAMMATSCSTKGVGGAMGPWINYCGSRIPREKHRGIIGPTWGLTAGEDWTRQEVIIVNKANGGAYVANQ